MKKLILLFALVGCAHHKKASEKDIDQYCQDLNVLYQKISIVTFNIVNINTTRTPEGGYYKRRVIHECTAGFCKVETENTAPILKYEPGSPDRNKQGYVVYPSINLAEEQYNLKQLENTLAVVTQYAPVQDSFFLQDERAKKCFEKYDFVNEKKNFRKILGRAN